MSPPLLHVEGIEKRFGATRALHEVHLTVRAGEVLALIGENGAGKSTLLKTFSGAHRPDAGTMRIDGRLYQPTGPADARAAGVAMIYQELILAPDLSVEDNILLGQSGTGGGLLDRRRQRRRVREVLDAVGLGDLDPRANAGIQSVATKQLLEVARALASEARIVLFDEPTSSLPQADVARLFQIIARLKAQGIGVIYISHFLEEVREVADHYAVLRDGRMVGEGRIEEVSDDRIVALMVGREVNELYPRVPHKVGAPWVDIKELSASPQPTAVRCQWRAGEIFGIAGLVGAGRSELLRTIFGLEHATAGTVRLRDRPLRLRPRSAMRAGVGMLSEDRKGEGLAQDLSLVENITLGWLTPYSRGGWLKLAARRRRVAEWMQRVEVKAASPDQRVSELSGGNQQKVAIARILHQDAQLLLLDEPTKGIDVGTKSEIYRMMGQLAADGKTIVFVSSYLPELLAVCDRIGVMSRGRLQAVKDAADWTADEIMAVAIGGETDPQSG